MKYQEIKYVRKSYFIFIVQRKDFCRDFDFRFQFLVLGNDKFILFLENQMLVIIYGVFGKL